MLQSARGSLENRFNSFVREVSCVWDQSRHNQNHLLGMELTKSLENSRFEIALCGRTLQFAFTVGLTDEGQPRGCITCTTPDDRFEGSRAVIAVITFKINGDVEYPPKPTDFADSLQIDDTISAIYIISYCVYKVLRLKVVSS